MLATLMPTSPIVNNYSCCILAAPCYTTTMNATLNTNSNLDPQSPVAHLAHVAPDEAVDHTPDPLHDSEAYDGGGWPGDGSGADDLADMHANEADDYRDEGMEDYHLDASYEERFELPDY